VVVAAYNAERHVGDTVRAILAQTRAPHEVIVVDDGSTDGTADVLAGFGHDIRVIRQANSSAAGAYNRGFAEARGDYIARCDADDVWQPQKLERQLEAVRRHPEVTLAIGAAWIFGREDRLFAPAPGEGVLEHARFAHLMFDWNVVCSSTALIKRTLVEQLGPLIPGLVCEDYEYWLRALRAGATVYYDPEVLVRYRQHDANVTNNLLRMYRATHVTHRRYTDLVDDDGLVRRVLGRDLATIGRLLVADGDFGGARKAFRVSARMAPSPETLAWVLVLATPLRLRTSMIDGSIAIKRALRGPHGAVR
jgi:glycosyltransferase involved in cell wall biosynthesis